MNPLLKDTFRKTVDREHKHQLRLITQRQVLQDMVRMLNEMIDASRDRLAELHTERYKEEAEANANPDETE